MKIPFTVLEVTTTWHGRPEMLHVFRANGKNLRPMSRIEEVIQRLFNATMCANFGHHKCDIPSCECGKCYFCNKDMEGGMISDEDAARMRQIAADLDRKNAEELLRGDEQ